MEQADKVTRLTHYGISRLTQEQNDTAIPWRGKRADDFPDGPRDKAIGNHDRRFTHKTNWDVIIPGVTLRLVAEEF